MFNVNGDISSWRSFDRPEQNLFTHSSTSSQNITVDDKRSQRESYLGPMILMTPLPTSAPFNERIILLCDGGQEVKIGRALGKLKPANDNTIFDCKVLSRSHASLTTNDGKIWIVDTKSSNGTWVNGQRLSPSGEESSPRELFSGDVIQFGVEIEEMQTAHASIIAQVTIFDSHGNEVRRKQGAPLCEYPTHSQQQIYQLSHYLQEALFRERALARKTERLQTFLADIENATEHMWQLLLNEDRLMSKLKTLELQLAIYSASYSPETLEALAAHTLREKRLMEEKREDMYEGLLQEKLNVLERLGEVELHLINSEEECVHLRRKCEEVETSFSSLYQRFNNKLEETEVQQKKIDILEDTQLHVNQSLRLDKMQMQKHVEEMEQEIDRLQEQLDRMEAERINTQAQYKQLRDRFEYVPDSSLSFVESDDFEDLDKMKECASTSSDTQAGASSSDFCNIVTFFDDVNHGDVNSQYETMNIIGKSEDVTQPHSSMVMSTDSAVVDSPSWEEEISLLLRALRAQIHYCQTVGTPSSLHLHDVERMHAAFHELDELTLQTSLSEVADVIRQHVHYMLQMLRNVLSDQQQYHSNQQLRLTQQLYSYTQRVREDEEAIKALQEEVMESQELLQEKQHENDHLKQLLHGSELRCMRLEHSRMDNPRDSMNEECDVTVDNRTLRRHNSTSVSPLLCEDDANTFSVLINHLRSHASGTVEDANLLSGDTAASMCLEAAFTTHLRCGLDISELTPEARWVLAMSVVPLMVLLLAVMVSLQLWITGR